MSKRQAVTRVKLEQASKVKSWMPTRLTNGEGWTGREEPGAGARQKNNRYAPDPVHRSLVDVRFVVNPFAIDLVVRQLLGWVLPPLVIHALEAH